MENPYKNRIVFMTPRNFSCNNMKTIFLIAVTAIISSSIQAQTKAAWVIPGVDKSPALTDFATKLTSVNTTVSNFAGNAMMINVMEMEASKIAPT